MADSVVVCEPPVCPLHTGLWPPPCGLGELVNFHAVLLSLVIGS